MGIVFFENFENDTAESILDRYPGSKRALYGEDIGGWPLQRIATSTSAVNDAILEFSSAIKPVARIDLYIELDDNGDATSAHANNMLVIANNVVIRGASSTSIQIYPVGTGTTLTANVPDVKTLRQLYIGIDYAKQTLFVLADDNLVLMSDHNWVWVDGEINNIIVDATTNSIQNAYFPNFLKSIVIATDLPEGQILDTSTIDFHVSELTVNSVNDMSYSDTGYVEDVDKADPTLRTPGVFAVDEGSIEYGIVAAENSLGGKIYAAGRSDKSMWLEVGGPYGVFSQMAPDVTILPALPDDRPSIRVAVTTDQPWISSNGLGMEWGGELSLISYADLSTRLGFTAGTLMAENSWLKVRLDGQEMYVAKTPVRHSVSWDQIYAAGLVYGVDGLGTFPGTAEPVNQNKTIEIGGRVYRVRLLKGVDTDPSTAGSGNDVVGTHNSEWTRLFAPIGVTDFPSYTGPKLANYSDAELGIGVSLNGRASWCQETYAPNTSNRYMRGSGNLSFTTRIDITAASTAYGWRPVLELVT